jgi:hypothetical protein
MSQLELINSVFKLPITYNEKVKKLNESVITDLELKETIKTNEDERQPIYHYICNPTNSLGKKVIDNIVEYYTTDKNYLIQSQELLSNISCKELEEIQEKHSIDNFVIDDFISTFNEIKGETGFCEKYLYIDWNFAKFLNNNPTFLQFMSIYNIASPIISLCIPIFVLIIPFFVIKIKGLELSIKEYIDILKLLISQHSITKIFTDFNSVNTGQKIYLLASATFYLFSIYQNILICIRFYSNMKKIHDYLFKFKAYFGYTLENMNYLLTKIKNLKEYEHFSNDLVKNIDTIQDIIKNLHQIDTFNISLSKFQQIGNIMYNFYQIYDNVIYNDTLLYSLGINGYINVLYGIRVNIDNKKLNFSTYDSDKPIFKKMYYPKLIDSKEKVENDCDLTKNMVLTGPNASGKTTTLKTTLINILTSQQFGCGCFTKLDFTPYDNIHCYLNIPDTSARDSLFQAEARRCKEIIDCINEKEDETHFCIFDELYSGTNPDEAVVSAYAFMQYISRFNSVTCLLTTHYIKLCKKLSKNQKIVNYNMKTIEDKNNFKYTYKIVKGISKIKGGLKVLNDMNYPKEILEQANKK